MRILVVAAGLFACAVARADLAPSVAAPSVPAPPPPDPTCGSDEWEALHAGVVAYCAVEPARDPDEGGRKRLARACRHIERALRRCADGDRLSLYRNDGGVTAMVRDPARPSYAWRVEWSGPAQKPHVVSVRYEYDDCDCC
jgi:hypothetical protein